MIENNPTNVSAGFEMLLEETEAEIEFFAAIGRKALDDRDLDRVEEAVARCSNAIWLPDPNTFQTLANKKSGFATSCGNRSYGRRRRMRG